MRKFLIEIDTQESPADVVGWLNSQGHGAARWVAAEGVREVNPRPPVLLPYQQAWVDDRSTLKVWDCDRRIGSTTAVIEEALQLATEPCGGAVVIVTREYGDADCLRYNLETRGHFTMGPGRDRNYVTVTSTRWPILLSWGLSNIPRHERAALVVLDSGGVERCFPRIRRPLISWLSSISKSFGKSCRVALVGSGLRESKKLDWDAAVQEAAADPNISLHITRAHDAMAQGLGRKVCDLTGQTWSPEWDANFTP